MSNQTVITQTVDGIDVVKGFGRLSIDPVETKKIVSVSIKETDEFKAVSEKQTARNESAQKANDEGIKLKQAKKSKNKSAQDIAWRARETHRSMTEGFEAEIKERLPALKKKRQELMTEQAIYFEPKRGEIAKSGAEIQALSDVLASVQGLGYVDIDGNILEDNRGAVYCVHDAGGWKITRIQTIGVKVPASAVLYSALDESDKKDVDLQIKINAASVMSAGEKLQAKTAAHDKAVIDAGNLDRSLQIQGATADDALVEAQNWLVARDAELIEIYT